MTTRRPLPRSLPPHPDESLPGYLLNLAVRLRDSPGRLAVRLGLGDADDLGSARVAASHAVRLAPATAAEMQRVARLTPAETSGLTLARWEDLLFTSGGSGAAARTEKGRAWAVPASTRACPGCLPRLDGPLDDEGRPMYALWKATWRTPWSFACVRHTQLLTDRCPACTTRLGLSRGDRRAGLLPSHSVPGLHPAACRARSTEGPASSVCGHRLDSEPTTTGSLSGDVADAQRRLDALLARDHPECRSLGAAVEPASWLRDLRLLAVALRVAPVDQWPLQAPDGTLLAVRHDQEDRQERRDAGKLTGARDDRTWTEPPVESAVTAALVTTAMRLLDADDPAAGRSAIAPLVSAVASAEPLLWARIRSGGGPSPRLARWTSPGHGGTFSTHVLAQAAAGTPLAATAAQVSQWATPDQDAVVAPLAPGASERDRRRATSLALVRLLHHVDLAEAADLLAIPLVGAQSAVSRTGKALRRAGNDDAYREAITGFAAVLGPASTDYGALRAAYGPEGWLVPDEDWQRMRAEMLALRLGRRDTDWAGRRIFCSIWLWARITGGDPALAPLAVGTSDTGRSCTRGLLEGVSKINRHHGLTAYLCTCAATLAG